MFDLSSPAEVAIWSIIAASLLAVLIILMRGNAPRQPEKEAEQASPYTLAHLKRLADELSSS